MGKHHINAWARHGDQHVINFFIDTENTGKDENPRIPIELAMYVTDSSGVEIGRYCQKLNNRGMRIHPDAIKIHGITEAAASSEPTFLDKREDIVGFIRTCLSPDDVHAGVFIAHNGNRCDFPDVFKEFMNSEPAYDIRENLPKKPLYTYDTMCALSSCKKTCEFQQQTIETWPTRTDKGAPSMNLKSVVSWIVANREQYEDNATFESVCGGAPHGAMSDAIAHKVCFFDACMNTPERRTKCESIDKWMVIGGESNMDISTESDAIIEKPDLIRTKTVKHKLEEGEVTPMSQITPKIEVKTDTTTKVTTKEKKIKEPPVKKARLPKKTIIKQENTETTITDTIQENIETNTSDDSDDNPPAKKIKR